MAPQVRTATQEAVARPAALLAPAQATWLAFVDKVERGEQLDPLGQYVAKSTVVAPNGPRVIRPKFDAALHNYPATFRLNPNGWVVGGGGSAEPQNTPIDNETETPPDPSDPGSTGGWGSGGSTTVTSTFTTSVGQGGGGYIRDLKLISGQGNTTSAQQVLSAGYIKLNADLNKGAGGQYIYLAYTRIFSQVLNGLEFYEGRPYSSPSDPLTRFATKQGSFTSLPGPPTLDYFPIWVPNQNPYPFWGQLDLNQGAGGDYIYSFQSKSPYPFVRGSLTRWFPYAEVGILSGNSSSITPPPGWIKYPADLNEGAGGDFIYFCSKY